MKLKDFFCKQKNVNQKEVSGLPIDTYWGKNSYFVNPKSTIGKYCSVAANVTIGLSQHPINFLSTHPFQFMNLTDDLIEKHMKIHSDICHIGNDVWIGQNVSIMGGRTIADGAIIGAGAVVTHDVPPYAIVAGVPARILRYRFSPDIIQELLELKWWNLPYEQLQDLPFSDISACIKILKERKSHETI